MREYSQPFQAKIQVLENQKYGLTRPIDVTIEKGVDTTTILASWNLLGLEIMDFGKTGVLAIQNLKENIVAHYETLEDMEKQIITSMNRRRLAFLRNHIRKDKMPKNTGLYPKTT